MAKAGGDDIVGGESDRLSVGTAFRTSSNPNRTTSSLIVPVSSRSQRESRLPEDDTGRGRSVAGIAFGTTELRGRGVLQKMNDAQDVPRTGTARSHRSAPECSESNDSDRETGIGLSYVVEHESSHSSALCTARALTVEKGADGKWDTTPRSKSPAQTSPKHQLILQGVRAVQLLDKEHQPTRSCRQSTSVNRQTDRHATARRDRRSSTPSKDPRKKEGGAEVERWQRHRCTL